MRASYVSALRIAIAAKNDWNDQPLAIVLKNI